MPRKYTKPTPEQLRRKLDRLKERRATDPVWRERRNAYYRAKYEGRSEEQKEQTRGWTRASRAGFTKDLVAECRALQGGVCAICWREMRIGAGNAHDGECADHDHETGQPRGLLCGTCNKSLGAYEKRQRGRIVIEPYERYLADPPAQVTLLRSNTNGA